MPTYLNYLLIALAVILLSALVAFAVMRKNNRAEKPNRALLILCTVLAMICAALTPPLANLLARELYFSVSLSLASSFILLVFLSACVLLLLQKSILRTTSTETTDNGNTDESGLSEPSLVESLLTATKAPEEAVLNDNTGDDLRIAFEEAATARVVDEEHDEQALLRLIDQALEYQSGHQYLDAILTYEAALLHKPEKQLLEWMIVDLCSLYKRTEQQDKVYLAIEENKNMLDLEVRENILRNL